MELCCLFACFKGFSYKPNPVHRSPYIRIWIGKILHLTTGQNEMQVDNIFNRNGPVVSACFTRWSTIHQQRALPAKSILIISLFSKHRYQCPTVNISTLNNTWSYMKWDLCSIDLSYQTDKATSWEITLTLITSWISNYIHYDMWDELLIHS